MRIYCTDRSSKSTLEKNKQQSLSFQEIDVMTDFAQGIMGSCCEALLDFCAEIVLTILAKLLEAHIRVSDYLLVAGSVTKFGLVVTTITY